jgi:hypothetical protein
MIEDVEFESVVTPHWLRSGTSPARRRAFIVVTIVLPLLLLVSLVHATPLAPTDLSISNPHIHEASDYLHANVSQLYYSTLMEADEQEFWLGGDVEGAGPDDVVDCGPAFSDDPDPVPATPDWQCGPYTVNGLDTFQGNITASLIVSPYAILDTRYYPTSRDTTPAASVAEPPPYNSEDPIPVAWSSSDTQSGVGRTYLYYRYGEQTWATQNSSTGTSGTFFFIPPVENVTYTFQTRAVDNVGNPEAYPSGDGDGSTIYDTVAPDSAADSPPVINLQTIPVSFTVAPDFSGLDYVRLHYRYQGGDWTDTPYTSTQDSGVLGFPAAHGDGSYDFQTIAVDNAGNVEGGPSAGGDTGTLLDTEPPTVTVETPEQVSSLTWQVSWLFHDSEPSSGPALYDVQYQQEGGPWHDWLTATDQISGTFGPTDPVAVQNHLTITFQARARDLAGNQGTWGPAASTAVDIRYTFLPLVLNTSFPWDEYYEDNDSFLQAFGPLGRGVQYRAYPDDRDDYYFFELPSAAAVSVNVTNFAPTSTYGDLILYNEQEEYVTQYGTPGKDFLLIDSYLLQPGKYYVRIYTVLGHYSTSQLYTLTLTW